MGPGGQAETAQAPIHPQECTAEPSQPLLRPLGMGIAHDDEALMGTASGNEGQRLLPGDEAHRAKSRPIGDATVVNHQCRAAPQAHCHNNAEHCVEGESHPQDAEDQGAEDGDYRGRIRQIDGEPELRTVKDADDTA